MYISFLNRILLFKHIKIKIPYKIKKALKNHIILLDPRGEIPREIRKERTRTCRDAINS